MLAALSARGGYRHCYGSACERSVWLYAGEVREFDQANREQDKKAKRRKRKVSANPKGERRKK